MDGAVNEVLFANHFKIHALFYLIVVICTIFENKMRCIEEDMVGLCMLNAMFLE